MPGISTEVQGGPHDHLEGETIRELELRNQCKVRLGSMILRFIAPDERSAGDVFIPRHQLPHDRNILEAGTRVEFLPDRLEVRNIRVIT